MKIVEGFILRQVGNEYIVINVNADNVDFNGMISLNEVGAFLWKQLENEITYEELVKALLNEYDVAEETARKDINNFIKKLEDNKLL